MAISVPFTVEDCLQGWPNEPVLYRIRVPAHETGRSNPCHVIRYLTAPNPPKGSSGLPDFHGEHLAFDTVPPGDWNLGRLVIPDDGVEGKFILASTETAQLDEAVGLPDCSPSWCNMKVDLVNLLDALDTHCVSVQADDDEYDVLPMVTDIQFMDKVFPRVISTPAEIAAATLGSEVIGSWAWQPDFAHGIARETYAYSVIQACDPDLAPRFLAHITDNGTRVIGFLLERIPDVREAGPADLDKCKDTLSRLHALGIAYGSLIKRHSFLVCSGDTVLLQGFGGSFKTTDKEVFGRELQSLEQALKQPSELEKQGRRMDKELSDKWFEFQNHGLIHPFVEWQHAHNKPVTLTIEKHREMVAELAANNYRWTKEDMDRVKQRFGESADVAIANQQTDAVEA